MSDSLKQYIRDRRLSYYSKEHKKQRDGLRSRLDATHASRWACILKYQQECIQKKMDEEADSESDSISESSSSSYDSGDDASSESEFDD